MEAEILIVRSDSSKHFSTAATFEYHCRLPMGAGLLTMPRVCANIYPAKARGAVRVVHQASFKQLSRRLSTQNNFNDLYCSGWQGSLLQNDGAAVKSADRIKPVAEQTV